VRKIAQYSLKHLRCVLSQEGIVGAACVDQPAHLLASEHNIAWRAIGHTKVPHRAERLLAGLHRRPIGQAVPPPFGQDIACYNNVYNIFDIIAKACYNEHSFKHSNGGISQWK